MLISGVYKVDVPEKLIRETDDAALVRNAKEGDMEAFETLIKRYQKSIYALCRRLTGVHQSADDAAQETFIKAYFSLARFDDQMPIYPWLRRIAVNTALNIIKSRRRETPFDEAMIESVKPARSVSGNPSGGGAPALLTDSPFHLRLESPEERFEKDEFEQKFQKALAALPRDQMSVFVLRFYENLSYGEISHALRLPAGTVMSRLNRARQKLKSLLADGPAKERRR